MRGEQILWQNITSYQRLTKCCQRFFASKHEWKFAAFMRPYTRWRSHFTSNLLNWGYSLKTLATAFFQPASRASRWPLVMRGSKRRSQRQA